MQKKDVHQTRCTSFQNHILASKNFAEVSKSGSSLRQMVWGLKNKNSPGKFLLSVPSPHLGGRLKETNAKRCSGLIQPGCLHPHGAGSPQPLFQPWGEGTVPAARARLAARLPPGSTAFVSDEQGQIAGTIPRVSCVPAVPLPRRFPACWPRAACGGCPRVSGCSCAPRHDPSLRGHPAFHGASLAQASSFYSACWGAIRKGTSGSNAPWRSLKPRAAWQPRPQPPVPAAPAGRGEGRSSALLGQGLAAALADSQGNGNFLLLLYNLLSPAPSLA